MLALVLEPFRFSRDGIAITEAQVGTVQDIPERIFDGLERAGYLSRKLPSVGASEASGAVPDEEGAVTATASEAPATEASGEDGGATGDGYPPSHEIRAAIKAATGTAPGPRTSRENLIAQYAAVVAAKPKG